MKFSKVLFFIIIVLSTVSSKAQSGNWVWLKGSDVKGSTGNYGTIGVSSPANEPPPRYQAAYWTDLNGKFWMFGGVPGLNDLWKYDPITNEWTWVKGPKNTTSPAGVYGTMGVPSVLNYPAAVGYGANCWTDAAGDLWLYSGYDMSGTFSNDVLWRYHIATNEWTWMKGTKVSSTVAVYGTKGLAATANTPGERNECKSAWVHNNKLWLFGGMSGGNVRNDLWSFDIATNNWTWEAGTNLPADAGTYGTKGVANATNTPPSRFSYTRWQDASNNFYLFGGSKSTSSQNDVWQYNTSTKMWTWVSGTNLVNDKGTTNPYCKPNAGDAPASRFENQTAQSNSQCTKAFWTFGGTSIHGYFNDLWLFNTENYEWTKVKGGVGAPPASSYGVKGVEAASNLIPGKMGCCVWTDKIGVLYVFGGYGYDSKNVFDLSNDLWKFIPDTACIKTNLVGGVKLSRPTDTVLCEGDTIKIPLPLKSAIEVQPNTNVHLNTTTGFIEFFGIGTTKYTITSNSLDPDDPCFMSDTISFTIIGYPRPKADFTISPNKASLNNPTFNFLNSSTNAVRYEWFYDGAIISTDLDLVYKFPTIGKYCVTLVAINKCEQRDSVTKCCYVVDSVSLIPVLDTTICKGDSVLYNIATGLGYEITPANDFVLDTLRQVIVFKPLADTRYTIITKSILASDPDFEPDTMYVTVRMQPKPKAVFNIAPSIADIENLVFSFESASTNAVSQEWYFGENLISTEQKFAHSFPEIGEYCVKLVVKNKCEEKDSVVQCCKVYKKGRLIMPNVFSPNGDGRNDAIKAILTGPYLSYSLKIVNRYGEEIFTTNDPLKAWDGRFNSQDQEIGVYYYLIKVKFDYPDSQDEMYKGDISLIR